MPKYYDVDLISSSLPRYLEYLTSAWKHQARKQLSNRITVSIFQYRLDYWNGVEETGHQKYQPSGVRLSTRRCQGSVI